MPFPYNYLTQSQLVNQEISGSMIQSVASLSDKEFIKRFVKTGKELFCDKVSLLEISNLLVCEQVYYTA